MATCVMSQVHCVASSILERDLEVLVPGSLNSIDVRKIRGRFPPSYQWEAPGLDDLNLVGGSFVNHTGIRIPDGVRRFLSLGPKFMLPSFTLLTSSVKDEEWRVLLQKLSKVDYILEYQREALNDLLKVYEKHVGDHYTLGEEELYFLMLAERTCKFLQRIKKRALIVEGDKGKLLGLVSRKNYSDLYDNFLGAGLESGHYDEISVDDQVETLEAVQRKYLDFVGQFKPAVGGPARGILRLFVRPFQGSSARDLSVIDGLNSYVLNQLTNVCWGIPTFRPVIKFHKEPVKLRPVICKRGTPSISIGLVIKYALSKVMHNYWNFDNKLNVVRVEELIEEAMGAHIANSDYIFFSLDVISMFDEIPMANVIRIVQHFLGMSFTINCEDGRSLPCMVDGEVLVKLMEFDSIDFAYFRSLSPRVLKGVKPRFYFQRKGIPMGGNTSNIYADLFMGFCLSRCRSKLDALGVKLMRKYVDDFLFYAPSSSVSQIVEVLKEATGLDFTVELPVEGRLPYLDVLLVNDGRKLCTTWYQKPITSKRLINYRSFVPQHEVLNTYVMRLVVSSRYDTGGTYILSYYKILQEMWSNSLPPKMIGLCFKKATSYQLGRCFESKSFWLSVLSQTVGEYKYGVKVTFEDFMYSLWLEFLNRGWDLSRFVFRDDSSLNFQYEVRPQRIPFTPGDPIEVLTYRGNQSLGLYRLLRNKYGRLFCTFRHDSLYSMRRLLQKGIESRSAHERRVMKFPKGIVRVKNRWFVRRRGLNNREG